ncbi:Transmembrane protein [Phytophthora megakarya]|uniref:Transmembrane protein n=1 Tax=Phytophthora megakarya TaxID=4795 RepID=A0A225WPK3_9STRA|nr:Transmembrane protein [Phytophthora megakarya]
MGSTSPLNTTLYLETATTQSLTGCSNVSNFSAEIYSNEFLRFVFSRLQMYASHNLSYMTELELISPVIDCTFTLLEFGDPTSARIYYLTRRKSNTTDVILLSTSLSVQDYEIDQQFQKGPATLLLVAAIDDVRNTTVNHHFAVAFNYPYVAEPEFSYTELVGVDKDNYWLLETLANTQNQDPAKSVRMARRFGRYISDPTAQSNIEMAHWVLPTDPVTELGTWQWHSRAVLHDSWAWTHAVHGIFAINVIFNLSVLTFVIYRRMRVGHIWVGDAFATISNMTLYRGLIVIVSNHMNGYWTITKMCISVGDSITGLHAIYYRPELVHADLLSIFLNVSSVISYIAHERLDPLLVFALFEFGWAYRDTMAKLFPGLKQNIMNFAVADETNGLLSVSPGLARLSPMELMTAYAVVENRRPVVFSAVISIFSPILLIAVYVALRKAFRYVTTPKGGDKKVANRRANAYTDESQQIELTSFEVATGAALSKRFGVIGGYENYIVYDNRLKATFDAVYGNGFLVANGKFLIGAQDLLPLILMKMIRVRFTNLFVYDIEDKSSVKQTAQLVYPSTISWDDLFHLDVTTLA